MSENDKKRPCKSDDSTKDKYDTLKNSSASCACECTGLIPEGSNQDEDEIQNFEDIYPFIIPMIER